MKPEQIFNGVIRFCAIFLFFSLSTLKGVYGQATCNTPSNLAGFEVDGDIKANSLSPFLGDSWYMVAPANSPGIGVIGTTAATATPAISASQFNTIVQSASGVVGRNRTYLQRMSVPFLTEINGKLLIDAFAARDNISVGSAIDSTVFTAGGQKNGDNPTLWTIGAGGVQQKNDIIDVGGHLRRQVTARGAGNSTLDLWMFAYITSLGTSGDRYSDIELFRSQPVINSATGHFDNTGPASTGGHTAFVFDNTGNVVNPGDLLISINYSLTGGLSSIRIWCDINNLDGNGNGMAWFNAQPNRPYNLTGDFITGTGTNGYGYAEISSLTGASCLVYSVLNSSTTDAGPWGNLSGSSAIYDANIQSEQLVNVAINLSDFGLDNSTVSGPCFNVFGSIIIKTRSSSSWASELKDFTGPLTFANFSEVNANAGPDKFITCDNLAPVLSGSSLTPGASYQWYTPNGNILSGSTTLTPTVNLPGTYILAVQNPTFSTCIATDTVIVSYNNTPPNVNAGPDKELTCTTTSVTLLGSSSTTGAVYSWTAINGGNIVGGANSATPVVNAAGCYVLTVSTPTNGCYSRDTVCVTLNNSAATVNITASNNVSCYGACNGSLTAAASGGQGPFTYNWSNGQTTASITNLCAGTYTVTVTGVNGCTGQTQQTVTQPAQALSAGVSATQQVSCFGGANGVAVASANGGTSPYTYIWSNAATTATINGLGAGTYTVTVTDAQNCTWTGSVQINQPATSVSASIAITQNVSCNGGSNGSLDLTPAGGTPPYTYQWSHGAFSQDVSNLTAGTYTVTVTDGNGCSAITSATITQPVAALSATASMSNSVSCFGSATGTATVNAAGGTTPYTYQWSNGVTTQTNNNLVAGIYTVTVTDANGCTKSGSVNITQPAAAISTSIQGTQPVSCFGGTNGSINLSVSGGTTPYTYLWSNGQTTQDISNLTAGTYNVTVTDNRGCTTVNSITITQPSAALAVSINTTQTVACYGGASGAAASAPSGGTPPYVYQWSNGSTTQNISNISAGIYTVTVTDVKNCVTSASFTMTQPAAALTASLSISNTVSCNGGNDGAVTNTVSGGTTPYTYLWSNGATTQNLSGVSAATYTVTVTDARGCTIVKSIAMTQPVAPLSGTVNPYTNISCFGGADGYANLSVSGGTPAYTYLWSNGATTQDISSLPAGTYSATITDSRGCTLALSITLTQPSASLSATITGTGNVSCYAGSNGTLDLTVIGGTAPYNYSWSNGSTNQDLSGLGQGTYSVTVTDSKGCTAVQSGIITQPAAALTGSIAVVSNVSCNGGNNGSLNLTVSGGTLPYTFLWNNGSTVEDPTGLTAGVYTVTVTDVNGCTAVVTAGISQPVAALSAGITIDQQVSCFGGSDGILNLTVSGGTTPYTYNWSNGQTVQDINGLSIGSYTVTVTDNKGCTATATANITQPAAGLSASTTTTSNISCFAGANGSIDLTVNGGTAPYTYNWSNGATAEDLSGLPAGSYSVTITDANGCTQSASGVITQPPGSLGANIVITQQVACYGGGNGAIDLTVSGGTPPYNINWSNGATTEDINGLAVGNYTVNITDANGCITAANASITQPAAALSSTLAATQNVSCFGGNDGTLNLTVSGGTIPYTYAWSNGATTQDISNLSAGTYTVNITDANGCTGTQTGIITQPSGALAITLASLFDVTCNGLGNGSINVSVNGGTGPYSFSWSSGATVQNLSNIGGGVYDLTVTDVNGCNSTIQFSVNEPPSPLNANISSQVNIDCFGNNNGSAALNVSGGTTPYSYLWSNGSTAANLSGVGQGNYSVTVTDANGCTETAAVILTQPGAALSATATVAQNVSCYSGANGQINLNVSGGTTPYVFNWSNGATTQHLLGITAGTYTVTVTDNNGCTAVQSVTVTEPAATITGTLTVTNNVSCHNGTDGAIDVTISGGTLPYSYQWNTGDTTEDIFNLVTGTYTVTVNDVNGCSVILTGTVTEPSATLTASIAVTQQVLCFGDSSGMLDLTVTGGTTPYTFNWNNGATTEDINNVPTGLYSVSIVDINGCTASASTYVSEPRFELDIAVTANNPVLCNGGNDGSIDLLISGGTPAYSFNWSNGSTTEDLSNLSAGIYAVTVTDANGCQDTMTIVVTEPAASLAASLVVTQQVNCFAGEDGAIDLTVSGGTAPYTYLWSNGSTSEDQSLLIAGTYTVTVTDQNGCSTESQIDILEPSAPLLGVANIVSNVFCNGGSNGAIDLVVSGGTAPYTFNWSNGATTEDISNLTSGVYTVTITDANGCTNTVSGGIGQPSQQLSASILIQNVLCFGGTNGFIDVTTTGGTAPYSYNWSTGSTTEDLGGLGAGTYVVTIVDANGCDTTLTGTITEPAAPLIPVVTVDQDVSCYGGSDGALSLGVTGGTTPYTYLWNTGATTQNINNLPAGMYTVTVTDANGCNAIISQTVGQPAAPLTAPLTVTQNVLCHGGSDGSVMASPSGGTAPYAYIWNTGDTTASISGVAIGTYTVLVTDSKGCTYTDSITVGQPSNPIALSGSTTVANCLYSIGGTATAAATGGTPPYSFIWSTGDPGTSISNVPPGSYTVTVTDANGCTETLTLTVGNYSPVQIQSGPTEICIGSTAILAVDSIPGATYQWYYGGIALNGATNFTFETPAQGTYFVTVTSPCGSFTSDTVTVTVHAITGASISNNQVICPPESVQLVATGGTSYSWTPTKYINFTNVPNPSVYPEQTTVYTVVVSDDYGCTTSMSVEVAVACDSLFIPNGFSPNDDGINDGYVIDGILSYPNNKIWVYNRWGNLIYKTKGYANQWDGVANVQGIYFGQKVPPGTYFFILDLGDTTEKPRAGYLIIRR